MGALHEHLSTYMIITQLILLGIRNISRKHVYFTFNYVFSVSRVIYDKIWKNSVYPDRPQKII